LAEGRPRTGGQGWMGSISYVEPAVMTYEADETQTAFQHAQLFFRFAFLDSARLTQLPELTPLLFAWGKHTAYIEVAEHEKPILGSMLEHVGTFVLAVQMDTLLEERLPNRLDHPLPAIQSAARIAKLIRNAFAHNPFSPRWLLTPPTRNQVYEVPGIISLDTTELEGLRVRHKHFGGPVALLRLSDYIGSVYS